MDNQTLIYALYLMSGLLGLTLITIWILIYRTKKQTDMIQKSEAYRDASNELEERAYCFKHKHEHAIGICAVCEVGLCEDCQKDYETLHFCPQHFNTYTESEWLDITEVKTTPDNPEKGLFIYDMKNKLYKENNIPCFVMTHYKIDVHGDQIESHIKLYVRLNDVEKVRAS
ncbi:MAG: hypothetical protein HN509_00080, partial [Halobacteriovoraceae bacterium]|nr:hypothetical protein [Halobacteriovoraceae bacterium]